MTSTDLAAWSLLTTLTGQSGAQTYPHAAAAGSRFYRLRVSQ